jgi:hypothetical protein
MSPEQERVFKGALRAAAAIRETARAQAFVSFSPVDPTNFEAFTAAVEAADVAFKVAVTAAAVVAGITLTQAGPSS